MWAGLRTDDLFNPQRSQPAADFPNGCLTCAHNLLSKICRSGVVGEIHQTSNTVIDALLSVAKRGQPPYQRFRMGKYRTLLRRFTDGKTGEPLFLIAKGFCKYCQVSGYGVAIAAAPESTVQNRLQALLVIIQGFLNRTPRLLRTCGAIQIVPSPD